MTEEQKRILRDALWRIANELRGKMDADEFRDYILGFIFFKYLSERMHQYANNILSSDGIEFTEIEEGSNEGEEYLDAVRVEAIDELGYFLRPSELFDAIAAKGAQKGNNFILDDLSRILTNIQKSTMGTESEEDFDHLFEDMDLGSTKLGRSVADRNDLVAKVLVHLQRLDFHLHDVNSDVLGDAYEYLIGQFASGAGKKAGEFYTPQQVSEILAQIVTTGKERLQNIYDPTCGSGSLLLRVARKIGHRNVGGFYGQELNRTTYNLARMNMILHGVHYRKFDIKQEDTLERPQHDGMTFEAVVANPPFSANWSANPQFTTDDRFSTFGGLPPESKADYAFVLHMIHHLADNGTMAVILPHGALFRGGREGAIRKILIAERNYLDAVIGLPANIFYGTSIPTCIMVFKKCRENQDDVLFIDASGSDHFEKVKNQNILRESDVDKIIATYRNRSSEDRYSHVALVSEIEENDFNLNIPRYVDTFVDDPEIDLVAVTTELKSIDERMAAVDARIVAFCGELGLDAPLGPNAALLQIFKRGVMRRIFEQTIRFKCDDGSDFPNWNYTRLGLLGDFSGGGTPDTAIEEFWTGDIPWVSSSDVFEDSIHHISLTRNITKKALIASATKTIPAGSILIVTRVGVGKVAISPVALCTSQDFSNFTPYSDNVRFLAYWLVFNRNKLLSLSQGTSIKGLTTVDLKALKIELPHVDEQEKIADFLNALDDKIAAASAQIDQMQAFKKGMLPQIFI